MYFKYYILELKEISYHLHCYNVLGSEAVV